MISIRNFATMEDPNENKSSKNYSLFSICCSSLSYVNLIIIPYSCINYKGVIFLIPYLIFVFICAIPISYIEVLVGQMSRKNVITAWNFCPLFSGIGPVSLINNLGFGLAHILIAAISAIYLFNAIKHPLHCGNCHPNAVNNSSVEAQKLDFLEKWSRPVDSEIGFNSENHLIFLFSFVVCALLFLVTFKKRKEIRIVKLVLLSLQVLIMSVCFIGCFTLKGSTMGMRYFFQLNFGVLNDYRIWKDAGYYALISHGIGFGLLTTLAKNNFPDHNIKLDIVVFCVVNFLTLIVGILISFSLLGFFACKSNMSMFQIGHGEHMRVSLPMIVVEMNNSQIWGIINFASLMVMGLNNSIFSFEVTSLSLYEILKRKFSKKYLYEFVCFAVSGGSFLIISCHFYVRKEYISDSINRFLSNRMTPVIGLLELVVIIWLSAYQKIKMEIKILHNNFPAFTFKYIFSVVTSTGFLILIILEIVEVCEMDLFSNLERIEKIWAFVSVMLSISLCGLITFLKLRIQPLRLRIGYFFECSNFISEPAYYERMEYTKYNPGREPFIFRLG